MIEHAPNLDSQSLNAATGLIAQEVRRRFAVPVGS